MAVWQRQTPGAESVNSIDAFVAHSWRSEEEVLEYVRPGWREYLISMMPKGWQQHLHGSGPRPARALRAVLNADVAYHHPDGDDVLPALGDGDYIASYREHANTFDLDRVVLCHGSGRLIACLPTARLTVEVARAINDWTADRWLNADPRFFGTILIANQVPEEAAAEIRRVGQNPRMVAVAIGGNGLGKPFGHPVYHEIYRAASEMALPIVIASGTDSLVDSLSYPTAGGLPGSYSAYRVLSPQALMTHTVSLIGQGVFEKFPGVRFMLAGGSIGWIPPFLWRFDTNFQAFRVDAPWLKVTPTDRFLESFRVCTFPFSYRVGHEQFAEYLTAFPEMAELICFGTGYPDWDHDTMDGFGDLLPADWMPKVLHDNAAKFFRWPGAGAPSG